MGGRRDDDTGVTLMEVYRLIMALKDEHGDKLDAIDTQVRLTNGRTTRLEGQVEQLMRPNTPVVTPEGESLSIKISPKMWLALVGLVGGLAVLAPKVADLLFGK